MLLSLLRGPQDWLTSAAVLVATELAMHEPAALREVRDELADLARHMPDRGAVTFAWPLAFASQRLPCFSREASEQVAEIVHTMHGEYEEEQVQPEEHAPPAKPGSDNTLGWLLAGIAGLFLIVLIAVRCT